MAQNQAFRNTPPVSMRHWLEAILFAATQRRNLTFSALHRWQQAQKQTLPQLQVFLQQGGNAKLCNATTTPHWCVSDCVQAALSVPGFFTVVAIRTQTDTGIQPLSAPAWSMTERAACTWVEKFGPTVCLAPPSQPFSETCHRLKKRWPQWSEALRVLDEGQVTPSACHLKPSIVTTTTAEPALLTAHDKKALVEAGHLACCQTLDWALVPAPLPAPFSEEEAVLPRRPARPCCSCVSM